MNKFWKRLRKLVDQVVEVQLEQFYTDFLLELEDGTKLGMAELIKKPSKGDFIFADEYGYNTVSHEILEVHISRTGYTGKLILKEGSKP